MRNRLAIAASLVTIGCAHHGAPPATDSAAVARQAADSVLAVHARAAPALDSEARGVMVELLAHPATARFDSMIVTQPAMANGNWPSPVVCGRIGGRPGVKGTAGMTPFIYANRVTVFVLDATNGTAFANLRTELCDGPGVTVLMH